ncbi:MAG: ROK family protein [Rubrimonas sp.]
MQFGIDIGGTKIAGAVLDAQGAEIAAARRPNPRGDYPAALAAVAEVVTEMAAQCGARPDRIGVGICGIVDAARGEVRFGNAPWLTGRPLRDDLETALGAKVRLANDADCFALSEARDGAAAGANSAFGLILGTGVGGGFAHRGVLVTGARGVAGEIGHVPMPRADADELSRGPCSCGRHGCVETLLSGPSLGADYARAAGLATAPDPRAIAARAEAGEAQAEAALARYVERLARVLGMLANLIEPDVVVLGGGVSNIDRIRRDAEPLVAAHVFGGATDMRLLRNVHGDSSGVRGAARLWKEGE